MTVKSLSTSRLGGKRSALDVTRIFLTSVCESGDYLAKGRELSGVAEGADADLLREAMIAAHVHERNRIDPVPHIDWSLEPSYSTGDLLDAFGVVMGKVAVLLANKWLCSTNYRKRGIGMYATLLTSALIMLDIDVTEAQAEEIVVTAASLISIALWVWGQITRKDLEFGVKRK